MFKGKRWAVKEAARVPSVLDIAWASGFVERDGHIGRNLTALELSVQQKQKWPVLQLQKLFGDSLGKIKKQGYYRTGTHWCWRVSGKRAGRCARVIYPYLSPLKKKQVDTLTWRFPCVYI